ncbi:MAG: beta-lactamase family protein [Polyangiaceae bacterium]|nr:beta-lactamase family protein [Polyangiaceae bacterium]
MKMFATITLVVSMLAVSSAAGASQKVSSEVSPNILRVVAHPAQAHMNAAKLELAAGHVQSMVDAGVMDGAVLLVARHGKVVLHRAFGHRDGNLEGDASGNPSMPIDGIFDLQSMTKVLTSLAALDLHASGHLDIHAPVSNYIPEFASPDKASVTVADLIRFTSGHGVDSDTYLVGDDDPWDTMIEHGLVAPPRSFALYSDIGYRLLGRVVEVAGGAPLDVIVHDRITGPLGMNDTAWRPIETMPQKSDRFVGTGYSDNREHASAHRYMRGEVADDQDFYIEQHTDSVTGCDGAFSTAWDMALLGQWFLNRGTRILGNGHAGFCLPQMASCTIDSVTPASLINASMSLQSVSASGNPIGISGATSSWLDDLLFANKGYGWELGDLEPGAHVVTGQYSSHMAVSKIGGAGTFITVDPDPSRDLVIVLLTNHGLPSFFGPDGIQVTEQGALIWPGYENMLNGIGPHIVNDLVQLAIKK